MTTEQEITKLNMDVAEIKTKINDVYDILAQVNENIKTISTGIYGDDKNDHIGVIAKQRKLEEKIKDLETQINAINQKNIDQDLQINVKKNIWTKILEWVKWAGLVYLVLKGVFGVDALFGGKFL